MVKYEAMKYSNLTKPAFFLVFILSFLIGMIISFASRPRIQSPNSNINQTLISLSPSLTPAPISIPTSYEIPQKLHVYQTFNNCGPATLSMALSYVDININQQELGDILRPYQVPSGDNDDKSVTLIEVAKQAQNYGLYSYLRPNGNIEKIKQFIANDIPVVTRTCKKVDEDIGHYRVIRGYDDVSENLIQDDSLQGENLRFSYSDFKSIWVPFNYEYLVIVTDEKKAIVEKILGDEMDEKTAWKNAKINIEEEISINPSNWHLTFALSRIYYYLGDFERSVEEFNKVENIISFRTLWYQIEPVLAVYETGDYTRVFQIADNILNNENRAYSELYILKGDIYKNQGNFLSSKAEYEKALIYNQNNQEAKNALANLTE